MTIYLPTDRSHLINEIRANILAFGGDDIPDIALKDGAVFSVTTPSGRYKFIVGTTINHSCEGLQLIYCKGRQLIKTSSLYPHVVQIGASLGADKLCDTWFDNSVHSIEYANKAPECWRNHTQTHLGWFIALLACGLALEDAILLARSALLAHVSRETIAHDILNAKIKITTQNTNLGIYLADSNATCFKSLDHADIGLYPVVNTNELLEKLLKLGIKTIQLRIKNPASTTLEADIQTAITLGREHNAQVFINDHWKLAIKHDAYGVHLGQEDLTQSDLSQIRESGLALGISTHSYYEVLRAITIQPSYIALGHVFPTTTKQMKSRPQGLNNLKSYVDVIKGIQPSIPTVAIGGIDLNTAETTLKCGVDGIAVVRAVTQSNALDNTVASFNAVLDAQKAIKE